MSQQPEYTPTEMLQNRREIVKAAIAAEKAWLQQRYLERQVIKAAKARYKAYERFCQITHKDPRKWAAEGQLELSDGWLKRTTKQLLEFEAQQGEGKGDDED